LKRSSRARLGVEAYLISFEEHLYHSFPREEQLMKKQIIEDRRAAYPVSSIEPQELSSPSATVQLRQAIEQEKARRVSQSRPLEVVHYQPGAAEQARQWLSGWHLLFFARAGSQEIQDLGSAMQQQGSAGDEHLLRCVQKAKAQYREYMAHSTQAHWESVQGQAVIAEIRYGSMSLIPGFWLPEEMELGLSLLPRTGARLPIAALTLVEHCQATSPRSLEVLLVTAPPNRTKAELATERLPPVDTLAWHKRDFTLSTPVIAFLSAVGVGATAEAFGVAAAAVACVNANHDGGDVAYEYVAGGAHPSTRSVEDLVQQQAERVRGLGEAPSASQLLEARERLLTGEMGQTR
jgi:hypothetical protein